MADGGFPIINKPIENLIQCIHCNYLFGIDHENLEITSVEYYLSQISYTAAGNQYLDEYYFDTANVPYKIRCPHCEKDFDTVAQVTACPVWNYEEMSEGRVPSICYFKDVEILNISSSFEITTSIQECFKCDIENPEDFELNGQYVLDCVSVPNVVTLKIIAKTRMSKGFCYLGLEESTNCIFRPIFNTSSQKCCWPDNEELVLGLLYRFNVIMYPNQFRFFTPFPHRNEDMIVSGFDKCSSPLPKSVYPSFIDLAKKDVEDIFKDIKTKRYVNENTQCSSVGIIKSSALIVYNEFKKKYYCTIKCESGVYVLPITATNVNMGSQSYIDAVIVLGLGRPYKGKKKEYDPARCYLLVVGIYIPIYGIMLPPNQ